MLTPCSSKGENIFILAKATRAGDKEFRLIGAYNEGSPLNKFVT